MRLSGWLAVFVATVSLATVSGPARAAAEDSRVLTVDRPPTEKVNAFYPSNREPLLASPFAKLPIGAIKPKGWLRRSLEIEADGMTGHLTEISRFCKAEDNAWLSPEGKGHSPWEELPYWLKGFGDLGYVLGDERLSAESRKWIEGILSSQREDGWFGPRANLMNVGGKSDIWPNMLALNALQSFYEFTGDKRVLPFMLKYFRWQQSVPEAEFISGSWQKIRAGDNLESIYWLYNRTGEAWLLDVARKVHEHAAPWAEGVANWHGVNISQSFREPAIFYVQAKEDRFVKAAYRNYDTVRGIYGQVPGGGFGADENCRPGYVDPHQGTETCTWVEFMHSFQMLTRITGDPLWADRCEEIAFNSFPCSQTPDQKGLHYLTAPNQPVLDTRNHSPGVQNRGNMFGYDPHGFRCCQHNVAMGWPYYAEEMWLATADGGLAASLYAPSEVAAKVGDGTQVRIAQDTGYPVDETVTLAVSAPKPVRFPLYLRIPRWCDGARLSVNGKPVDIKTKPLSYAVVDRTWADGDKVTLELPMRLAATVWEKNKNAVSVSRGPLTFSLAIGEKWSRYGGTDAWPGFEVLPTTPWNYGLQIDPKAPDASVQVTAKKKMPDAGLVFSQEAAPIELAAEARKIPAWGLDRHGLAAVLQPSPAFTEQPAEKVTLIPMGWAALRISAFPTVSTAADANQWAEDPTPTAMYAASASFCHSGDTVEALCDGVLPRSSNDHSLPRFTWWDHKGTPEWVAYKFSKPRTLSWCDVYWFDDTGRGGCRIPASWQLLYKDGDAWKPVTPSGGAAYGTAKDTFNKVTFEPVTTSELRLEVKLQPDGSGGILEWRIGPAGK
ncbi:MAG: glycoside hydrolase family 127 protein [Planctomycetota bacterium]|nr:glycoside hydrolase family 127 protein [Planctomycetota bacterium]